MKRIREKDNKHNNIIMKRELNRPIDINTGTHSLTNSFNVCDLFTRCYSNDDIMDGFAQMEAEILKFFGFDDEPAYQQEEYESFEYFTPVTTGPIIPGYFIMICLLTHSLTH